MALVCQSIQHSKLFRISKDDNTLLVFTNLLITEWLLHASCWPVLYALTAPIRTTCLTVGSWLAPGLFLQGYHYLTSHFPFSDFKPKPCKSLLPNLIFLTSNYIPCFHKFWLLSHPQLPLPPLSSTAIHKLRCCTESSKLWDPYDPKKWKVSSYYVKKRHTLFLCSQAHCISLACINTVSLKNECNTHPHRRVSQN